MFRSLKSKAIQSILDRLAPGGVNPENIKFNVKQLEEGDNIVKKLKPGDLIFSQTPHQFYALVRLACNMTYDHVVVVLNDKEAIHISPPVISRINIRCITLPYQNFEIIRPNLDHHQMNVFLQELCSFLGQRYSYHSVKDSFMHFVRRQKPEPFQFEKLRQNKICSNVILYCLCRANPFFRKILEEKAIDMAYGRFGNMLPDSVKQVVTMDPRSEVVYRDEKKLDYSRNIVNKLMNEFLKLRHNKAQLTSKILQHFWKHKGLGVLELGMIVRLVVWLVGQIRPRL